VLSVLRKESHFENSRFPKILAGSDFFFLVGSCEERRERGEEGGRHKCVVLIQLPWASRSISSLAPSDLYSRCRFEETRRLRKAPDFPANASELASMMAPSEFEFQKRGSPVSHEGGKKLMPTTVPLSFGRSTTRGTPLDQSAINLAPGCSAPGQKNEDFPPSIVRTCDIMGCAGSCTRPRVRGRFPLVSC